MVGKYECGWGGVTNSKKSEREGGWLIFYTRVHICTCSRIHPYHISHSQIYNFAFSCIYLFFLGQSSLPLSATVAVSPPAIAAVLQTFTWPRPSSVTRRLMWSRRGKNKGWKTSSYRSPGGFSRTCCAEPPHLKFHPQWHSIRSFHDGAGLFATGCPMCALT